MAAVDAAIVAPWARLPCRPDRTVSPAIARLCAVSDRPINSAAGSAATISIACCTVGAVVIVTACTPAKLSCGPLPVTTASKSAAVSEISAIAAVTAPASSCWIVSACAAVVEPVTAIVLASAI